MQELQSGHSSTPLRACWRLSCSRRSPRTGHCSWPPPGLTLYYLSVPKIPLHLFLSLTTATTFYEGESIVCLVTAVNCHINPAQHKRQVQPMVKLFLFKTIKKPWVRFQIRQHQPMLLNQLARLEGGWNASEYNILVTEKFCFIENPYLSCKPSSFTLSASL